MPTLTSYFNDMDDPRGGNAPRHKFCDLMTISLLCALCGGETAVDMELFGNSQAPLHPVIGGGLGSFEVSPNYHMAFEAFVLV